MGAARNRQPNKTLRVAEAIERVRLEKEDRYLAIEETKRTRAKLKAEQREAILVDDTLDDETKESLCAALDRRKIRYSLLSMLATSVALMDNPIMAPYADMYRRRSKGSLSLTTPHISSGVVRTPKEKPVPVVNVGTIGHCDHNAPARQAVLDRAMHHQTIPVAHGNGRKVIISDKDLE